MAGRATSDVPQDSMRFTAKRQVTCEELVALQPTQQFVDLPMKNTRNDRQDAGPPVTFSCFVVAVTAMGVGIIDRDSLEKDQSLLIFFRCHM